jgi:protein-S-isoprenylcysteine O-methyltransferase Ste14
MLKWIDMPPVWLAGFLVASWAQATWAPMGLSLGAGWLDFAGGVLVGGGILLIALAAMEFRKYKTTIVPHETPARLIQSGIFKRSRNPIYLGDALILAGLILRWDAVLSLPLIPVFVWVIERRFVIPEENRMRRTFRADFARYCEKTRRWL